MAKPKDLKYLVNTRPLTLLNLIYKISTKAYQIWLTSILQRFISQEQSPFIKGETIHHSLMMKNEVLAEASCHDEDYIYLKLDVIKAFNCIEWAFLLTILRKFGFRPCFLTFVKASQTSSATLVLINGRRSSQFRIKEVGLTRLPLISSLVHYCSRCIRYYVGRNKRN